MVWVEKKYSQDSDDDRNHQTFSHFSNRGVYGAETAMKKTNVAVNTCPQCFGLVVMIFFPTRTENLGYPSIESQKSRRVTRWIQLKSSDP